jgi:lincosamide nucleotidyltransferase A/C/D/E
MLATDVLHVLGVLRTAGVCAWVDGGWGVDALAERETRVHDDLDLVIDRNDVDITIAALAERGFVMHRDERPVSFVLRDCSDRRVDLHPIRVDAAGGGYQALPNGGEFYYDPEGLSGTGLIADQPVACLSVDLQIRCHSGYDLDADDHLDLAVLHQLMTR